MRNGLVAGEDKRRLVVILVYNNKRITIGGINPCFELYELEAADMENDKDKEQLRDAALNLADEELDEVAGGSDRKEDNMVKKGLAYSNLPVPTQLGEVDKNTF